MSGNISNEFTVDPEKLAGHVDELAGMGKAVSEKNGELRNRVKAILDEEGYHAAALAMVRTIDRMSETKQADFLRTFRPMFTAMDGMKWADRSRDMVDIAEDAA